MAREDAVTKAWREALDLSLHRLDVAISEAWPVGSRGAVRVSPSSVLAIGRAGRVGDALLTEQQERPPRQTLGALGDRAERLLL